QEGTTWRRRFGIEAAVARAIGHAENRGLSFKTENRAVNIRLAEEDARIVDKIAGREIVGAIYDDVVIFEEFEGIRTGQLRLNGFNLNVRVEIGKTRPGGLAFRLADVAGAKRDLALKIGEIHDVEVDEAEFAHTSGRKI